MFAPKGLKVGDTFKDEMGVRKVLEVGIVDGVEAYTTVLMPDDTPVVESIAETIVPDEKELDYEEMTLKELQNLAKERGLAIRGSKQDVIDRLRG